MGLGKAVGPFSSDSRAFALYRLSQTTERAPELLDALRSAAAAALGGQGCLSSRALFDATDPGVLMLLEEWEDVGRLEAHLRSRTFQRVLSVLELSQAPPEVVYVVRGEVRGLDWLAEVMTAAEPLPGPPPGRR